jgi:hypothetical protein
LASVPYFQINRPCMDGKVYQVLNNKGFLPLRYGAVSCWRAAVGKRNQPCASGENLFVSMADNSVGIAVNAGRRRVNIGKKGHQIRTL